MRVPLQAIMSPWRLMHPVCAAVTCTTPERAPKYEVPGELLRVFENVATETACRELCLLFNGCNPALYTTSQSCILKSGSAADKVAGADEVVLVWCNDTP